MFFNYASEDIEIKNSRLKGRVIKMNGDYDYGIFICKNHYHAHDLNSSDVFEIITLINASGEKEIFIGQTGKGPIADIEYDENFITITVNAF